MIRFVFFDLDDTILDFKKAERNAIFKTLEKFNVNASDETLNYYSEVNACVWRKLERNEIKHDRVKIERFEIFLNGLGLKEDPFTVSKIYENFLSQGHYFINGALDTIKGLYKDYRLFIVSNGLLDVQKPRIKSANISKYFEDIFVSQSIGFNKPDERFFDYCFNKIKDFDREKAVIIGDSLTSDISGGKNVNIKTVWFNPNKKENALGVKPDYEVKDLTELKELLKNI